MQETIYSRVVGVGVYHPPNKISNDELIKTTKINSSNEWIVERTGINFRYLASPNETNVSMGLEAAKKALLEANEFKSKQVELIICATNTNFTSSDAAAGWPACAGGVQAGLENLVEENSGFFDVQAGCTGINYVFHIADMFIRTGIYQRVLVVGTDLLSGMTDFTDRETCVVLGDGATAYVLDASKTPGFIAHRLSGDGAKRDLITSHYQLRLPYFTKTRDRIKSPTLHMNGRKVHESVLEVLEDILVNFDGDEKINPKPYHITFEQIKAIIPHQANKRMFVGAAKRIAKKLRLDSEEVFKKFIITIENHANTSTASPGPGLIEARSRLSTGDHIIFLGMGAGFTWAANHYII